MRWRTEFFAVVHEHASGVAVRKSEAHERVDALRKAHDAGEHSRSTHVGEDLDRDVVALLAELIERGGQKVGGSRARAV